MKTRPFPVYHRGSDDKGLVGHRVQNAGLPFDDRHVGSRCSALARGLGLLGGWLCADSSCYSLLSLHSFSRRGQPRLHRLTTSRTKSTYPMGSSRRALRAAEARRFSSAPSLMARSCGDLRTGSSAVLAPGETGRVSVGIA